MKVEWCSASHPIPFGASSATLSHWHTGSTPALEPSIAPEWPSEQKPPLGKDGHRRPEQIKNIAKRCTWLCPLILGPWTKHFLDFSIIAWPLYDLTRKRASWTGHWSMRKSQSCWVLRQEYTKFLAPFLQRTVQVEWGFPIHGLSIHVWQHRQEDPTHPIQFHSHSFKDAEKQDSVWKKGLW